MGDLIALPVKEQSQEVCLHCGKHREINHYPSGYCLTHQGLERAEEEAA